ncbi:PTS fructose transporter subunit IIA [Spirochaetia bacterium]|nr:PTS fructose transporter subunit IIA [Spirochaetia bacterium]
MLLNEVFNKQSIRLNLESKTKEAAFAELVEAITDVHPELDRDQMLAVIQERESKMNTSVASGVAIPHGYYPGAGDLVGAIGISKAGIAYDAPDHKPVHFIFLIVMGEANREKHLSVLSRTMSMIKSGTLPHLQAAKSPEEVHTILSRFN